MEEEDVILKNFKYSPTEDPSLIIAKLRKEIASRCVKWIPVSERLPEERIPVLCWLKWGECAIDSYIEGNWYDFNGKIELDDVTHWADLMAGPEEGK